MLRTWLACALAMAASGSGAAASETPAAKPVAARTMGSDEEVAVIQVPQGVIVVKFFDADAPKTVANFKNLVRKGFYDGTTFHRLVPGFVIQGGDPNSRDADLSNDGTGGSEVPTIPGEFSMAHKHVRGTLSMARKQDPNSATCQFFICLAPAPSLDGKYAAFGQVIQGLDVVDKVAALANAPGVAQGQMGANPGKKAVMQKVTLEPLSRWVKPAVATPAPAKGEFKPAEPRPAPPKAEEPKPAEKDSTQG